MSSPYRNGPPAADEPTPDFGCAKAAGWKDLVVAIVYTSFLPVMSLIEGDRETTRLAVYACAPLLPFFLGLVFLERPVRAWLDRRYARRVAKGVEELEAKAARA
jgi:hypothetical protein